MSASIDEVNKEAAPVISKIHRKFRMIKIIWGALFLMLVYLCITALAELSKSIVQPLGRMVISAEKLEKGDVPEPLSMKGDDEIATLAKSFDNLVKSFLQRQDDVNSIQKFLRSIIRNSPDMIIVADSNAKIIEFNQAAEIMLGYSCKDVLGLGFELFFYVPKEFNVLMNSLKKECGISSREITMITLSGDKADISLSLALIKDETNGVMQLVAIGKIS